MQDANRAKLVAQTVFPVMDRFEELATRKMVVSTNDHLGVSKWKHESAF